MPKKKKQSSTTMVLIAIVLIAVIAIGFVAWHDGRSGLTLMGDINDGSVAEGTSVTVKGVITNINTILNTIIIGDDTGGVVFEWADASSMQLQKTVVVRGVVFSLHILTDVSSVEYLWLFA